MYCKPPPSFNFLTLNAGFYDFAQRATPYAQLRDNDDLENDQTKSFCGSSRSASPEVCSAAFSLSVLFPLISVYSSIPIGPSGPLLHSALGLEKVVPQWNPLWWKISLFSKHKHPFPDSPCSFLSELALAVPVGSDSARLALTRSQRQANMSGRRRWVLSPVM